jgi:hypothetical protein
MRKLVTVFSLMLATTSFSTVEKAFADSNSAEFVVGVRILGKEKSKSPVKQPRIGSYTWGAAGFSLSLAGYTDVSRYKDGFGVYWFSATQNGLLRYVSVSKTSGEIVTSGMY